MPAVEYLTERDRAVLAGERTDKEGKPVPFQRHEVLAAAWARGHELADEKHGEGKAAEFFTYERGAELMAKLEALPEGATIEDMMKVVRGHVGVEEAPADQGETHH